jgi:hypothetical protein
LVSPPGKKRCFRCPARWIKWDIAIDSIDHCLVGHLQLVGQTVGDWVVSTLSLLYCSTCIKLHIENSFT